jgi:hypothetical protein
VGGDAEESEHPDDIGEHANEGMGAIGRDAGEVVVEKAWGKVRPEVGFLEKGCGGGVEGTGVSEELEGSRVLELVPDAEEDGERAGGGRDLAEDADGAFAGRESEPSGDGPLGFEDEISGGAQGPEDGLGLEAPAIGESEGEGGVGIDEVDGTGAACEEDGEVPLAMGEAGESGSDGGWEGFDEEASGGELFVESLALPRGHRAAEVEGVLAGVEMGGGVVCQGMLEPLEAGCGGGGDGIGALEIEGRADVFPVGAGVGAAPRLEDGPASDDEDGVLAEQVVFAVAMEFPRAADAAFGRGEGERGGHRFCRIHRAGGGVWIRVPR